MRKEPPMECQSDLSKRIDILERKHQRLQLWCLGALSLLATSLLLGAARLRHAAGDAVEEVRAERFVIVSDTGKVRGTLGVVGDDVRLSMLNAANSTEPGVVIEARQSESSITLGSPDSGVFMRAHTSAGISEFVKGMKQAGVAESEDDLARGALRGRIWVGQRTQPYGPSVECAASLKSASVTVIDRLGKVVETSPR
jgi:hypothetical protein